MPAMLRPMSDDEIAGYVGRSFALFIDEVVATGVSRGRAEEMANETREAQFPGGRIAEGNLFFDVIDGTSTVGVLWLGINPQTESWWIYDIEMHPRFRGLGHGRETLLLAEAEVRNRGGHELGLNVFGSNSRAIHLYESVGYETQNVRMKKLL